MNLYLIQANCFTCLVLHNNASGALELAVSEYQDIPNFFGDIEETNFCIETYNLKVEGEPRVLELTRASNYPLKGLRVMLAHQQG